MKKKLLIIGSGGQAVDVIDQLLREEKEYSPVGVITLDKGLKEILGVPVVSHTDDYLKKVKDIDFVFPAIGFGENVNNSLRKEIYERIKGLGFKIPSLVSSKALIKSNVKVGEGAFIQSGSIISSGANIG